MKKLMALLLSLVMLLSLAACGGKENPVNDDDDEKESTVQTDDKNGDKDDDTVNEVPKGKKKIEKYGLYLYIDEKYEVDDTYDNETNCIYEEVREITLVSGLVSETTNQYATGKEMAQGHYDREKDGYQTVELGERNGVSYVLTTDDDGFYYVTSYYVVGERWWMIHVWYLDAVGYEDEIIEIATSAHAPEAEDSTVKPNDKEDDDGLPAGKQKVEIDGLYVFVDEAYEIRDNYDYEKTMSCYMGDREDVQLSTDLVSNGRYQFSTSAEMAQVYFDAATEEKLGERNGISYVVDTDEEWVCVTGYYVVGDQWWTINVYSVSGDQYREEMIDFVTTAHVPQTDDVDQGNSGNDAAEPSGALYEELMNHPESPESDFWVNDNGDGTGVLFRYNGSDEIVVIPETINGLRIIEMADFAFWNNETLKAVRLADSIETAGMYAFQNNTNLEVAVYGSGMRETGSGTFHNCESLYQVVLNDGIEVIEGSCFYGCTALETIHIPDSVKEVVYLAFSGCTSLKEIKLPEGIEYVSGSLFVDCTSLKSVYIPDSVTSISQSAFMGCTSLESIEIPAAVTTIFENAFTAEEQDTGGTWENITWNYDAQTGELRISGEGEMPSKWPIYFPWKGLAPQSIVIEEGITSVSRQAFELNSKLTSVSLPDSLQRIDMDAFRQTGLTSVYIPAGITDMAVGAFDYSENLKEYVVDPANTVYCNDEHGLLFSKDMTKLWDMPDGFKGDYVVPDSVTYIYRRAFYGCENLTGLTFPAGTDIPFDDISQTPNLKKIIVDTNNPDYSSDAKGVLFNKDKTELLKIPQAYEGHYDIPEGVVKFGERSLPTSGCSMLTSISIPASTTSIEYYWDYGLFPGRALEKIVVHKDNPNYCDDQGVLYDKDMTELLRIPRGFKGAYTVPASVKKITFESAGGCEQLTRVTIMGELESISAWAFTDCTNLKEIWFRGNAPKKFGSECFYNVTATAYYPANNATWTEAVLSNDNHAGNLTWKVDPCSKAHAEVVDRAKDATCTESGLTEGKHCSVCGEVTVAQKTIAAAGHSYGDWQEIKAPTVEETGLMQRACADCGEKEEKVLDKLSTEEPDPTEPEPTEPEPTQPEPTEPDDTEPAPTEPAVTEPTQTQPTGSTAEPTEPDQTKDQDDDGNVTTVVIVVVAVAAVLGGGGAAALVLLKKFRMK